MHARGGNEYYKPVMKHFESEGDLVNMESLTESENRVAQLAHTTQLQ